MKEEIKEIIKYRIIKRIRLVKDNIIEILGDKFEFAIAGNSLNKEIPNDFDLYALGNCNFVFVDIETKVKEKGGSVLSETKNALTVKIGDTILQFCKYKLSTLKELVDTFDFAHIQIGASFVIDNKSLNLKEVYASENWEKAKLMETTFYTKPNLETSYPISSLIRIFKYKERGIFGDKSYIVAVFEILNQLVERGFKDYDDFKDQLSAVDLQLLDEAESNAAWKLFNNLGEHGLVDIYSKSKGKISE